MANTLSDVDLLARLVAFPSVSERSTRDIADFVCEYLERPGVRIERFPSEDGERTNVLATLGPQREADGSGLILCGHLDVVPAEEPQWIGDPFTLARRDGDLIARGACDMKGFNALVMNIAARTDPASLTSPLALLLTYDEEIGSLGAERFTKQWPKDRPLPRSALVGEPTSLLVVRMHKGHFKMRITIRGRSSHSGYPHLGRSAIEPAGAVVGALAALRREMERERPKHCKFFPQTPFVTLNIGTIHGGAAFNIIPDRCVMHLGLRPLPGMNAAEIAERVRERALEAAGDSECEIEFFNDNPAMLLPEDAPTHRTMCELADQHESHAVNYASDGGHLSRMGLECVLFGPGSIEDAHKPNERLAESEFEAARPMLERIVGRYCLGADA